MPAHGLPSADDFLDEDGLRRVPVPAVPVASDGDGDGDGAAAVVVVVVVVVEVAVAVAAPAVEDREKAFALQMADSAVQVRNWLYPYVCVRACFSASYRRS